MQKREPSQPVAPSQQGCVAPPQVAQVPVEQTLPALQVKPAQHIMPVLPHVGMPPGPVGGATQRPVSQMSPPEQSLEPAQPAPAGATHAPAVQVKPTQQSPAEAQRAPPGIAQHWSPRPHVRPSSHVRPLQQPPPTAPQRGAGPPPMSRRTAPSSSTTMPSRLPMSGPSSPVAQAESASSETTNSEAKATRD